MDWELHRPYLQKSEVLSQLLKQAGEPHMQKYYRNLASETLDTYIKKNNVYSNEYKDISNRYRHDKLTRDLSRFFKNSLQNEK